MKKMVMLETETDDKLEKLMEKTEPILAFQLSFFDENKNIHKVEVRNINFRDVMRHLQHRETVLITPEFPENRTTQARKQEQQTLWYIAHL
jgi:hypothetical protein